MVSINTGVTRSKQTRLICGRSLTSTGIEAFTEGLRNAGLSAEFDLTNKKFVKQLEKASKVAKYAVILGEDEISSNSVTVKNLANSEQKTVKREALLESLI